MHSVPRHKILPLVLPLVPRGSSPFYAPTMRHRPVAFTFPSATMVSSLLDAMSMFAGNMVFRRDVNVRWKHGINALPISSHSTEPCHDAPLGRISIIVWGNVDAVEEENSPPLLGADGQGPHAAKTSFPMRTKLGSKQGHRSSPKPKEFSK
jgi:hypothetical protein